MMKLPEVPTSNDLQGAAAGILRLQRMYNLNTADLAKGQVRIQPVFICVEYLNNISHSEMSLSTQQWWVYGIGQVDCAPNKQQNY